MHKAAGAFSSLLDAFQMADVSMRYSLFVPKAYNLALSLGFQPGKIMPSRAFCSDESQGYPIILLAKHFGSFPFNHGMVGGIVATDRHGPYAHHGQDLFFVQASHVGYDPETGRFGTYRRLQTENQNETTNCGKICGALDWYLNEYEFAKNNILLTLEDGQHKIIIDNQLLDIDREEGLMLKLDKFVEIDDRAIPVPEVSRSTSKVFVALPEIVELLGKDKWIKDTSTPINQVLYPDLFYFRRTTSKQDEGHDHLEKNLLNAMPYIVCSEWPALAAAQANTQVEFDRTFRSITRDPAYKGKKVLFISGLNVDISPQKDQIFPLTKFIPWAAYVQDEQGNQQTWEQSALFEKLKQQSDENPDQINLEEAIEMMQGLDEILLPF